MLINVLVSFVSKNLGIDGDALVFSSIVSLMFAYLTFPVQNNVDLQ